MKKILVIEDDLRVRELLNIFLSKQGFSVSLASSGKEGINLALDKKSDLVLIDMRLPDLEGIEVLKEIRRLNKDTKIIMLSGLEEEDLKEEVILEGASCFLPKSIGIDKIVEAVKESLKE